MAKMNIKLTKETEGYTVVREKCANCMADFVFRIDGDKLKDVLGDALLNSENKIECKICGTKFQCEVYEFKPWAKTVEW
jgi:hypothetical protein